jgi:hypothetical protein
MKLRSVATLMFASVILALVTSGLVGVKTAEAAGPCRVSSFSLHARIQMATRGISEREVRDAVRYNCADGFRQSNGTWKYPQGTSCYPTVILSNSAVVVTTWWDREGGGSCSWRVAVR